MNLTGQHLGKYELLERVGQGGMAYVYKAYQPTVDRYVAVKVLHSHLAEDEQFLERFRREAKGLGSLRHPHIVSVIDFDVDDGWYYMVMDFIEGETLEAMLDRRGRLPVDEALRLTAQLAGALDYAHRHGRIHRDIKPGNVMFAGEARQHAVITDFGLARLLDKTTITLSGAIAGTPAYMSPEAAQGEKVDARADIYSLGVTLYQMVTGQRPYAGETPLSIIMKLVLEPLPPALSLNPDLPPAVDAILKKATARQPQDRYQTAAAFLQALQGAIGDGGLQGGSRDAAPRAAPAVVGEAQTEIVSPASPSDAPTKAAINRRKQAGPSRAQFLPIVAVVGLLVVALVVGAFGLPGGNGETAEPTAAPTTLVIAGEPTGAAEAPTQTPAETPTDAPAPQAAGALRFAQVNENNLRPYTLSLDDVPAPPGGFHYELWFDIVGQPAPQNVAEIPVQNGSIIYTDVLANDLAASVGGARLSLEPDFDDDPSISAVVIYAGAVDAGIGLAQIDMFATGRQP